MATMTNRNSAGENIREKQRELKTAIRYSQRQCDHKNKMGPRLVNVHDPDNDFYIKDKHKLSDTTVVCKECHEIFEMVAYDPEEIDKAVRTLSSMLNQIKVLANLSDNEYSDVVEMIELVDDKINGALVPYYLGMLKKLNGNDKRRNNNDNNQKGRVGNISGSMGVSSRSFR